jgi:hypothetical protein
MPNATSPDARAVPCRHHWVIETPDGPTSEGRCKRCGQRKSFLNVFEDLLQSQQHNGAA